MKILSEGFVSPISKVRSFTKGVFEDKKNSIALSTVLYKKKSRGNQEGENVAVESTFRSKRSYADNIDAEGLSIYIYY